MAHQAPIQNHGGSQQSGNNQDEDDNRQDDNPIEFVDDSCERNQNTWLRFPTEFIRPAKMCSVNKYVQCVDESFLQHSMHHVPSGPEYVLVGHDSPSLPQHFFKWIWAMSQINCMQQYTNCVVPVVALTEVSVVDTTIPPNRCTKPHGQSPGSIHEKREGAHGNQHSTPPGHLPSMADRRSSTI